MRVRLSRASGVFLFFAAIMASGFSWAQDSDEATANDPYKNWDVAAPPASGHEISIDVTEGTWMSLDVSPDGQTIVFDLLGDIYLMPVAGGEASAISSGVMWDYQPRFSPDGSKIAFTSDRSGGDNIWVMNADGSEPRQVTDEKFRLLNNPTWSPDGQFIAARKHYTTERSLGTGEIWLYSVMGGKGTAVYERPSPKHQKDIGEPMFAPDGSAIYFSMNTTPGGTFIYAQDSNDQIYEILKVSVETGEVEDVVSGAGGAVRPTISPDGNQMAFVRRIRARSSLFIKDLRSGETRMIYRALDQDNQETWAVQGVYPNMDWTADGSAIIFWAGGKIRRIDVASGDSAVIPFHVSDTRMVYDPPRPSVDVAPDSFRTKMVRWAQLTPDESQVVFESLGHIYVKTVASGEVRRLTDAGDDHFEAYPALSRDGLKVAYVTWDDAALGSVRIIDLAGGDERTLTTDPGHYIKPGISPDGTTVVYRKIAGGFITSPDWSENTGIYRVPAAGGDATLITEDGQAPHFGASSERIYLGREGEDSERILVSVDLSGNEEETHATSEWARAFRVSPDGKWLAFEESYHIFMMPFARTGGAVKIGPDAKAFPTRRVSKSGGEYIAWKADGSALTFLLGPTLISATVSEVFAGDGEEYEPGDQGLDLSMTVIADKPEEIVALTGARIISMDASRSVIENGTILIEGNRIRALGPAGEVAIPEGATIFSLEGKTIMPGMVDSHAHGPEATQDIIPEQNWAAYATLALGVTTIHDPSNLSSHIFAASEYQRAGRTLGPRIFSTGRIVYGAHAEAWAPIDSYEDALAHVRRLKAQGAMSIKNYNQPRREQRQQVVEAARQENMLVVPEGGALYQMDLSMVADGNSSIEHSLPNQKIYEDVLQFWSATDVTFVPTLVVNYGGLAGENYWYQESEVWKHPILENFVPPFILQPRAVRRTMAPDEDYAHFENAAMGKALADRGVRVTTGAHGQREGLGTHWEMWMFVQGGMSEMEALATATIVPAAHLGMEADVGSLEVGKLADLIVMEANPLESIRNTDKIAFVMLNGRLYHAGSLDEMTAGGHKTENFFWWGKPEFEIR